jgi:hypothetical protein
VDNGSEFVNNRLIDYCVSHRIELTRSRPYRKNDQAWIEQKNGAVVRKLLGYRRFEGLGAARAMTRLYGASRLFVNFFQPSFKLAAKQRDGAKVTKRYYPPQTPCERLLQAESTPIATENMLREIAAHLDPLKLLEEMRAVQAYLAALANGEAPPAETADPPDLAAFMANLSSAWHAGEIRPTFSIEAKPRYLRSLQIPSKPAASPTLALKPMTPPPTSAKMPTPIYAEPGQSRIQALRMAWPIACRRLEEFPNINATQLFEELCVQFPGRFTRKQYKTLVRWVSLWRQHARARGVKIGPKTYRRLTRSRVVDVPISSRNIGKRWLIVLKRIQIRPHLNFSSSSKRAIRDNIVRDNFTRCKSACVHGANKPYSSSSAGSARCRDAPRPQPLGCAQAHQTHAQPAEVAAVLAWLNPAARRLRRWPVARVDPACARRCNKPWPGWRNGARPNRETRFTPAATGNTLIEATGNRIT